MAPKPPRREPLTGATAGMIVLLGLLGLAVLAAACGAFFSVVVFCADGGCRG